MSESQSQPEAPSPPTPPCDRPGYQTTEFWQTMLALVGAIVMLTLHFAGLITIPDDIVKWLIAGVFGGVGLYSVARGLAKMQSKP